MMPRDAQVYIYGSQARGDYSKRSDWDLLIIFNRESALEFYERGNYSMQLYILGAELGVDINPIFYTDKEWKERSFTEFFKTVENDRIKIWG